MDTLQSSATFVNGFSPNSLQVSTILPSEVHDALWSASLRGQECMRYSYLRRLCDFQPEAILAALSLADELGLRVI